MSDESKPQVVLPKKGTQQSGWKAGFLTKTPKKNTAEQKVVDKSVSFAEDQPAPKAAQPSQIEAECRTPSGSNNKSSSSGSVDGSASGVASSVLALNNGSEKGDAVAFSKTVVDKSSPPPPMPMNFSLRPVAFTGKIIEK